MALSSHLVALDHCFEVSLVVLLRIDPASLRIGSEVGHHIEALVAIACADAWRGEVVRGSLGDGCGRPNENGSGFVCEGVAIEDPYTADRALMSSLWLANDLQLCTSLVDSLDSLSHAHKAPSRTRLGHSRSLLVDLLKLVVESIQLCKSDKVLVLHHSLMMELCQVHRLNLAIFVLKLSSGHAI